MEDFERCVKEVAHIRQCLKLSTQSSRRNSRLVQHPVSVFQFPIEDSQEVDADNSDESSVGEES